MRGRAWDTLGGAKGGANKPQKRHQGQGCVVKDRGGNRWEVNGPWTGSTSRSDLIYGLWAWCRRRLSKIYYFI